MTNSRKVLLNVLTECRFEGMTLYNKQLILKPLSAIKQHPTSGTAVFLGEQIQCIEGFMLNSIAKICSMSRASLLAV